MYIFSHKDHISKDLISILQEFSQFFFFSFRIANPDFVQNAILLQNELLNASPSIEPLLIPPEHFHITLFVLRITTQDQLHAVQEILNDCHEIVRDTFLEYVQAGKPIGNFMNVQFKEIGNFGSNVLYISPTSGESHDIPEEMRTIRDKIHLMVLPTGLITDSRDWTPHCTIAKVARSKGSSIDVDAVTPFRDWDFGYNKFENIELLSMQDAKEIDGYYKSFATLHWGAPLLQSETLYETDQLQIYFRKDTTSRSRAIIA